MRSALLTVVEALVVWTLLSVVAGMAISRIASALKARKLECRRDASNAGSPANATDELVGEQSPLGGSGFRSASEGHRGVVIEEARVAGHTVYVERGGA